MARSIVSKDGQRVGVSGHVGNVLACVSARVAQSRSTIIHVFLSLGFYVETLLGRLLKFY